MGAPCFVSQVVLFVFQQHAKGEVVGGSRLCPVARFHGNPTAAPDVGVGAVGVGRPRVLEVSALPGRRNSCLVLERIHPSMNNRDQR